MASAKAQRGDGRDCVHCQTKAAVATAQAASVADSQASQAMRVNGGSSTSALKPCTAQARLMAASAANIRS